MIESQFTQDSSFRSQGRLLNERASLKRSQLPFILNINFLLYCSFTMLCYLTVCTNVGALTTHATHRTLKILSQS